MATYASKGFNARYLPEGYIFSSGGNCTFIEKGISSDVLLGILNSKMGNYLLQTINPTINFPVGCVGSLPIPSENSTTLEILVREAIILARTKCELDETSFDFISPFNWSNGRFENNRINESLRAIENKIDDEVFSLYQLSLDDRKIVEQQLDDPYLIHVGDDVDQSDEDIEPKRSATEQLQLDELARQWISYAFGIVMGRFQPGINGVLGRGHFSEDITAKLRALTDSDGILALDQGHPDDVATKVLKVLRLMLSDEAITKVVAEATGRAGNPEEELRRYFERTFFKEHIQEYRKRPVYWLLQSPRKKYGIWLFHEKLTNDTLYRLRG